MGTPQTTDRPVFFWQAVFILLPVAGLALLGLYSLRQDRLLAEQGARESAQVLVQRVSEAIASTEGKRFWEYQDINSARQASLLVEAGIAQAVGSPAAHDAVEKKIQSWEQVNSNIDLSKLPPARGVLNPQDDTLLPQPPNWFTEMSPEQHQLWDELKESARTTGNDAVLETVRQKFLASGPAEEAVGNMDFILLLAKIRNLPPADAVRTLMGSTLCHSGQPTEAGLPIGQVIGYRALRLLPDGGGVSGDFFQKMAEDIYFFPSLITPQLMDELQRVTKGTETESKMVALKQYREGIQLAERVKANFLERHSADVLTNQWPNRPFWISSDGREYMMMIYNVADHDPAYPNLKAGDHPYMLFPGVVMNGALDSALKHASYEVVEFGVAGRWFVLPPGGARPGYNANTPTLAEARGKWEMTPLFTNQFPFWVQARLTSPETLYASQRARTQSFGALILFSTCAAVMGLFAAWRSFVRQRELSELKSNFVSSVSHELRAPIASVRLMAENLEHGKVPEPERQHEYFRFIVQECRRLSSLIENVLDFSRIEQGRKQYELEPTDLNSLTQTTVKLMEPYAAEKGVKLNLTRNGGTPVELNVDGRAIQQALVNLIDNAVKHSAKGETVSVEIKPSESSAVNISVSDHGPGIPLAEQEKIFERFYRLGSELRRETQGVGIGLSVVKHIVEAHGGRVTVQSQPGQGSRFTIELPTK